MNIAGPAEASMSVEAPERIWVERDPDTGEKRWFSIKGMGDTEYVRIDKLEELAAENVGLLQTWSESRERHLKAEDALAEAKRENEALRDAGLKLMPYLRWTIGPESLGHHPTMPSAVNAFIAALEARNAGGKDGE